MSIKDIDLVQAFSDEAKDLLIQWESVCLDLNKDFHQKSKWDELFRMAHNLKGGSRSVGLIEYGDFVHKVEDLITLLRDQKIEINSEYISLLLEAQSMLSRWGENLKLDMEYILEYYPFIQKIEKQMSKFKFVGIESSSVGVSELHNENKSEIVIGSDDAPQISKSNRPDKTNINVSASESIRIQANKLDQLIQAIGELSIHQSIIWHTKGDGFNQNKMFLNSLHLSQKLTKELYDRALGLRMHSMRNLFQRLERNIVDLSISLGKEIEIFIEGSDVELDKTVIEKVSDPLMHLVRNAIDHGIETKKERLLSGKSESGKICLIASHDTHGVLIKIKDDGKGLDQEKIFKKALERKLVTEDQILSKEEVFNLIFLPGFSTADKVTDVSGRGVGMDVVRRSLDDLRGVIKIESESGVGTEFTIHLPTSVSIVDGVLFKLSGQTYVAPINAVEEVINTFTLEIKNKTVMMNLRNKVIPVQDLDDWLKHKSEHRKPKEQKKAALICSWQGQKVAFLADDVIGKQQIVIRPLHEIIDGAFGILGGTILGNGEPGLILDMNSLIQNYLNKFHGKELSA